MKNLRNADVADRLEEVAQLLGTSSREPFRARAYQQAARAIRREPRPLKEILDAGGRNGLKSLPGIGESIARNVEELLATGRLAVLDRLRAEVSPLDLLATIPNVGRLRAARIHRELGVHTLEDLESAAHDGRLERVPGIGPRIVMAVKECLAQRLGRLRPVTEVSPQCLPPVEEVLDVDREYRERSAAGTLRLVAPRRFNPDREPWLPVLESERGTRRYTALYSNTAMAHELGKTRDWVVILWKDGQVEDQCTVVTGSRGPLAGFRVIRGREAECLAHHAPGRAA